MRCRPPWKRAVVLPFAVAVAWSMAATAMPQVPTGPQDPIQAELRECQDTAIGAPEHALAIARKLLEGPALPAEARVRALDCQLKANQILGNAAEIERLAKLLLEAAGVEGLEPRARNHARMASALGMQEIGRFEDSLALMRQVRADAHRQGDVQGEIGVLVAIALVHDSQFDDGEAAQAHLEEAIALAEGLEEPNPVGNAMLHFNHGYVLLRGGRYPEADAAFSRAKAAAATLPGQESMLQRIASARAEILAAGGQPREARERLRAALAEQERLGDAPGQVVTLQRLARIHLEMGQSMSALADAERSLEMAREGRMTLPERDSLYLLVQIHSELGDRAAVEEYANVLRESARDSARDKVAMELAKLEADAASRSDAGTTGADAAPARTTTLAVIVVLAAALFASAGLLLRARRRQRQLAQLGATDALTGLLNRREATRLIERALAARDGRIAPHGAVLVLDVDNFKSINDEHGHTSGDHVLTMVAGALRDGCSPDDILARWGGEEFVVFRPGAAREADTLAERLRRRIERLAVELPDRSLVPVTISVGVSSLPLFAGGLASLSDSIRAADRAMYEAKHAGRNAWASIRGVMGVGGGDFDLAAALEHPAAVADAGVFELASSRDMPWRPLARFHADQPRQP